MADRALCRSVSPVVSRGVLRQRSDNPNDHNGSFNSHYHNIKYYDYNHNYSCHNHHRDNDGYYRHNHNYCNLCRSDYTHREKR
jgi:hypothetical protein